MNTELTQPGCSDATHCYMAEPGVRITVVSKLRHAELHALANKLGGQAALARILGVEQTEISRWCNMQSCPPMTPKGKWTQEKIAKLEADLLQLTGKLLDDLFPSSLRENQAFLNAPKVFEQTKEIESFAMQRIAENFALRTDMQPARIACQNEIRDSIAASLAALSERQRDVIERRFAINGKGPQTYEEIGKDLKITRNRVRQCEAKALRKLKEMEGMLLCHMKDADPSM